MGLLDALARILATVGIKTDVMMFLVLFGLAFARILTALTLAPFVGGGAVPARIKVGLAAIVTSLLLPQITASAPKDVASGLVVALLIKEVVIGATIGMISQFVFYSLQMAGTLIDTQRGMNQITIVAPQLPGNTSAIGQLQFQAGLVLFLAMDGHLLYLKVLTHTFIPLPLTTFPQFHGGVMVVMDQMARLTGDALVIGVTLAAPVLLALFLLDVGFGALGKVAAQINIHSESQPVKSLVGLAVFLLAAGLILGQLKGYFIEMLLHVEKFARGIA